MRLRYIEHADIDRQLYNSCIHYALNGRAWGYKWYLDATARRFDVLVEGEYESVMPLVSDQDWLGRTQLGTPVLTPALGVFSVRVLSPKRLGYFLREAEARFDNIDLSFTGEAARGDAPGWKWDERDNLVLPCADVTYEELAGEYSPVILRQIAAAQRAKLLVHANLKPERVAAFVAEHVAGGQTLQHPMLRVLYNAMHRGWGWTSSVTDDSGQLLAVAAFVFTHGRIAKILDAESPSGKTQGALALLYDYALRQSAGRQVVVDFASNDLERYGFGAKPEKVWRAKKSAKLLGILPI